jgi:hypothetical protein
MAANGGGDSGRSGVAAEPAAPMIDIHTHFLGVGDAGPGAWMSPRFRRSANWAYVKLRLGLAGRPGPVDRRYAEKLAAWAAASPLDHVLVQAFDGVYDGRGELDRARTDFFVSNDYVFGLCREFPRLLPAASLNPARRDWSDELEKCAARGARYVKINPCAMGLDPAEPRWQSFFWRMRELNLTLMSHVGPERSLRSFGHQLADPARLEPALAEGLTVIAAHAGTAAFFDRFPYFANLVRLMERHGRLYADSSAVAQPLRWHWMRRLAAHDLVRSRLLHGSDFPVGPNAFPWAGLSWRQWRAQHAVENRLARDLAIKEAFGFGRESAARAARVLGLTGRR